MNRKWCHASSYHYDIPFGDVALQMAWSFLFTLLLQNISNCHVRPDNIWNQALLFWRLGWVGTIPYLIQELSKIIFVFINFSECQSHVFYWKIFKQYRIVLRQSFLCGNTNTPVFAQIIVILISILLFWKKQLY